MEAKITKAFRLLLLVLSCCWIIADTGNSEDYESEELTNNYSLAEYSLINQRNCRLPNLDVFGPDVMMFYGREPDLVCDARVTNASNTTISPLFSEDTRFLYFNASALPFYDSEQVECTYASFERIEGADDNVKYSCPRRLRTDQPNEILDEFVKVLCKNNETGQPVYEDYFAFLPPKAATEKRCEGGGTEPYLNTLVVGLDTLSRLQFHRHFPRSATFMKERLRAVEMMGYNKVAENTYPNLVPLLSGMSTEQLDLACLRPNHQLVDSCPIIWKKYHQKGFRTVFVEDAPDLAIFNWGAKGFLQQPTDYYLRPMYLQYERNVGHNGIGCGYRCLGSRSSLSFLLKHAEKTARVFRDKKYFAFHWSCSATHDTFNIPPQVDETLATFLDALTRDNLLNNTMLIVMADHGPRMGSSMDFVKTEQGFYEKRLPLLMLAFPDWFEEKYPTAVKNLRRNSRSLTTHYDLHRTLYDLMNLNRLQSGNLQKRYKVGRLETGRSLFLPISTNRTCYDAFVPTDYCACKNTYVEAAKPEPLSDICLG